MYIFDYSLKEGIPMIALEIQDTKDFMNKLLISPIFDHFCLIEATIATNQTVTIDGKINEDFFSQEELESLSLFNTWEVVKPLCFQVIKGNRTPLHFKITLTLSPSNIENVLKSAKLDYNAEQVKGLLLNLRYDGKKVTCITGTSMNIFTMDKRLEQHWDSLTEKFFKKNEIISTQL